MFPAPFRAPFAPPFGGAAQVVAAFLPADVSGYLYDWNAASLSGLSDGATIATWTDGQSAVALAQAIEANKLTKQTVTFNGKTFIVARSTDLADEMATASPLPALAAMSIYIVMKSGDSSLGYPIGCGSTSNGIIQGYTTGKYAWWNGASQTVIGDISTTNFQTISTAVGNTSASRPWMLAGNTVAGADTQPGDYTRIIVYNRVVTAGEDTSIKAYLSGLYGTA